MTNPECSKILALDSPDVEEGLSSGGWWGVGTYDSVGWAGAMPGGGPTGGELPEDEGGQPMSPLTGALPDAASRLWTAVVAADPDVSDG